MLRPQNVKTFPSLESISEIKCCIVPSSVIAPWKAGERVLNEEAKTQQKIFSASPSVV